MNGFLESFIQLIAPRLCAGCEAPAERVFCESCESLLDRAEEPEALFVYGGPIADAIHKLKYRGRSDLGERLGSLMGEAALRLRGEVDAVVPVPLHWRRRRWRGYDQAALLARPIAKALGVPASLFGLRRIRHTPSQIDLPHHERRRNVAGAFAARRMEGAARVLLVDDVRTTGATLGAAAEALRAAGVAEVRSLVLAARVLGQGT